MTALTQPWLGATFFGRAGAMPPNTLGIAVTSASPATIPLNAVLGIGGAGCDGLIFADLAELVVPTAGFAVTQLPLPDLPVFAGLALYHYVAALEFDLAGNAIALTSTPRLMLTLGAF